MHVWIIIGWFDCRCPWVIVLNLLLLLLLGLKLGSCEAARASIRPNVRRVMILIGCTIILWRALVANEPVFRFSESIFLHDSTFTSNLVLIVIVVDSHVSFSVGVRFSHGANLFYSVKLLLRSDLRLMISDVHLLKSDICSLEALVHHAIDLSRILLCWKVIKVSSGHTCDATSKCFSIRLWKQAFARLIKCGLLLTSSNLHADSLEMLMFLGPQVIRFDRPLSGNLPDLKVGFVILKHHLDLVHRFLQLELAFSREIHI